MYIDGRTVYRLLDYIACEVVFPGMRDGKTLEEIDGKLYSLRRKDRIAVYDYMVKWFPLNGEQEQHGEQRDAIVAHVRALKRRKRQPTRPPATVISFRPEERDLGPPAPNKQ